MGWLAKALCVRASQITNGRNDGTLEFVPVEAGCDCAPDNVGDIVSKRWVPLPAVFGDDSANRFCVRSR